MQASAAAAPQQLAGYRLLRLLGEGAHGRVFVAQPSAAGAGPVALKIVNLGTEPRLEAEFRAVADLAERLRHPNIVAVLGSGIEGPHGWLAMELLPAGDVAPHTRAGALLPLPRVLDAGADIAAALGAAHRAGVVHRDLKPANVLIADTPGAAFKLTDFGLARVADAQATATGLVPGSPAYMAPEQLAGAVPTAQSDFYALGAMLFQLLAGRLPHEATSMGALLRAVAQQPAPDLASLRPDVAPPLAALVARLLAKTAAQRPADGAALADHFRALRQQLAPPR